MAKMEFGELDQYLFGQATHYDIYKKLGAHPVTQNGKSGTYFAVWAPNAEDVSVVGEFNDWDPERHPMKKTGPIGVWETFVAGAKVGDLYKFCIRAMDGRLLYKADPYASWSEMRPGNASRIADITGFKWGDAAWMKKRKETDPRRAALSIYEVHPGSWKKHPASEADPDGFYSYRELAHELADYVKRMGYTHVELMGIAEHPFDGSWGYQVTGYYAPTARFGSPKEFKYLVNYLHKNKIGVILDWVPAHFPKDAHGLAEFDGTCIYEHSDPRQGEHPDWGTKIFNYGKNEVKNFLIANALYWIEEFHVDGLRVDAVASMVYLEYILVLSHDEVVPLKCSMINKIPGEYDDKFENLTAGYSFMMGHPGKKLLFMGQEFGQFQEWSEARELDWYLLREARHQQLQDYVRDLQMMYKKYPALYADANGYDGFQWINADDADRSIYSFIRWSPTKRNNLLFVCNFTPVERKDYWVGVPQKKQCKLIMSSADKDYGGHHHV